MPDDFLKPRLIGSRFDGGAIPLEVLADFAGLNELLIETAKWVYLQDHSKRKRSPRGFAQNLELKIVGIEDGSAKPVIQLFVSAAAAVAPALFPVNAQVYMERARDTVITAIDAAATGKPITLPPKLLRHFERFGRSLQDGELIEFRAAVNGQPAVCLDKPTRRALLLAPPDTNEVTDPAAFVALIPNVLQSQASFEVELADGPRVNLPFVRQYRDEIFDALRGYEDRQRVLIEGVGRYNRHNRLVGMDSIDAITPIHPLDVGAQLDDLRVLKAGWFNGDGPVFSGTSLDRLEDLFYQNYPAELSPPHLYPTPEGHVRAEWSLTRYEASLEIDLTTLVGYWHVLNLDDNSDGAYELNLAEPAAWEELAEAIRKLPGGQP